MSFTLSDIPHVVEAGHSLVRIIQSVLDPKSPGGRRVTREELGVVLEGCASLILAIARAAVD